MATFVLLLAAGVVALLFAMRLTAAAFGCAFSPFTYLGLPADHGSRAGCWPAPSSRSAVLVWLVLRHGEETLWLRGEAGGVLVPAAALARLAEGGREPAPGGRARRGRSCACATARPAAPCASTAGPLADPARLAAEVEPAVRERLARVIGVAPARVVVRPRILTVPQLKRYLP